MNIVKPLFVILFIFLLEISMAVFIFTYFKDTSSNASVSPNNNNGNEGACEGENCINPQPEKTKYPDKSTTIENSPQTDIPSMEPPPEVRVCKSETCLKSAITLKANMDLNVDPCEDFYRYSCGGWLEKTHLPDDGPVIGSLLNTRLKVGSRVKDLLGSETLESDPAYESAAETYYAACMNTGQIEERGAKPLLELISTVGEFPVMNNTWKESDFNIEDIVIKLYELGLMPFMTLYVDPFKKDPKKMFSIDFPYHLLTARNDSNHQEFMMKALQLLGAEETVLETDFEAMKDFKDAIVKALYNQSASVAYPLSIDKLQEKYNWLDWLKVLKAIGAKGNVVIESTDTVFLERDWYLDQLADILNSTSKRAMANYMMSCLLTFSDLLDNRFRELTEKYPTNGLKIPTNERWKICVKATEEKLPEAVGRMYVNKYLRKKDKDFVTDMIKDIKTTFHEILEKNAWLSNETKARAQTKLSAMGFNVGYPDYLLDDNKLNAYYSNIFQPGYKSLGFFDLSMLMVKNNALENLNILAGDVENEKWLTSTSVVNAHYHPRSNSMYILAGIFEEPAYYPDGTSSMNYASIGTVIGHEISHGFDTQGSRFDENGELNNWWDFTDEYVYLYLASCYAAKYNTYTWEGYHVDGYKTLDENLADNTGLEQSYNAYRKWVEKNGAEEEQLPDLNLTHDQIFFVSFAQLWCSKVKEGFHQQFIEHERHSQGNVRVQGPISNSPYFAKAFNCKINSTMNPEHKCQLFDITTVLEG